MVNDVLKTMGADILFSDYIEIFTSADNSSIYCPVYSKKHGLYLYNEDEKPISYILLFGCKIAFYYVDGEIEFFDDLIIDVKLDESKFKKVTGKSMQGNLFQYGIDDAIFYNLDTTKAFPEEIIKNKVRKRSM